MAAMTKSLLPAALFLLLLLSCATLAWPWGNEGHSAINRVAAEKLPPEVPSFLRDAADQLAYLGPEPDRWRERSELALNLSQDPDHYINLERLDGMRLPADRYSFYLQLYEKREQTSGKPDYLLPQTVGLQPYIVTEVYERLVVAFREYRHALLQHRDPEFAERNATFYAGWLGHYVADASNPLHTTVHHNGWVGANPNSYTTANTIHWKMEGTFVATNQKQLQFADLVNASPRLLADPFQDYLNYLRDSHQYVEKAYQLEKVGGFDGEGSPESREFIRQRMAAGSQMLRDMWYSAWIQSAQDPQPSTPAKPASSPAPPNTKPPIHSAPHLGQPAASPPGR
jgi:hypothetical protein